MFGVDKNKIIDEKSIIINKFQYDAKIGKYYNIFVLNIILNILTLAIYNFWGRVRFRKYSASSLSFLDNKFEYIGTGSQLLRGFIKGVVSILILFFILYILTESLNEFPILLISAYCFIFVVICPSIFFIILYKVRAYRYSCLQWQGVKASLIGSARKYAALNMRYIILNIITLGYSIPYHNVKSYSFMTNNSFFGNANIKFVGRGGDLVWVNIITLLTFIPTFGLSRFWYKAAKMRYLLSCTHIANAHFDCKYTGGKLLQLFSINILILVCSLGFALPVVIWRNLDFMAQNITIIGGININKITQFNNYKSNVAAKGIDDIFKKPLEGLL
ncbi:YjgN family protein [Rickettsiales bacterium]|nr:YjgN family protein [Rickettsiales bacterium]MDB2550432.1 YjgN family protein [Rickettsiales bacterium]